MTNQPKDTPPPSLARFIRNRLISGLMVALPIAITLFIIYWLYSTLRELVIDPIASLILRIGGGVPSGPELNPNTPEWFRDYLVNQSQTRPAEFVAPIFAVVIVLLVLYFFGMFFQSRLHRMIDWFILQVPGVQTIYQAVRNVFASLSRSHADTERFKRVVLIKFPHPGIQVPAFVTSSCNDRATGKTILSVYVPTTPVPTSGYMLLIPEEEVVNLSWDLNETLQAIVSGGISVPAQVDYYPTLSAEGGAE